MTTEEEARRYDEALKLARDYHEDKNCFEYLKGVLENIFPELKESEDEKIRKDIINFVKSRIARFPKCERFVTWLEKQGEKKNKINITFEDVLALECSMKTAKITKGGDELYKILVPLYNKIHNAYLIEKQEERKKNYE